MAHKWRDIRRTQSPEQEEETRQYVKSVAEAVTLNQSAVPGPGPDTESRHEN